MGPVDEKKSSFSLEDYELSVLDKGAVIELMGQYEGIPFSQNCEVTERDENKVVAQFNFSADLTQLPYKAKIAAIAEVALTRGNAGLDINMAGQDSITGIQRKRRGRKYLSLTVREIGSRIYLAFVIAACQNTARATSPADTPGDTVGMLFPPLVGLW